MSDYFIRGYGDANLYHQCLFTLRVLGYFLRHTGMNILLLLLPVIWCVWILALAKIAIEFGHVYGYACTGG